MRRLLADCHLHFEGSLPDDVVRALGEAAAHPLGRPGEIASRRASVHDPAAFLAFYADVCRLFRTPDQYREAAIHLANGLAAEADGLGYAEVYVSPEIFARMGLDVLACLEAIGSGFDAAAASGGADCRILLDTVRHWGPEAADRVLDAYELRPGSRVVGFGMGGDEGSFPAAAFSGAYARARSLGLKTSVHAGEWLGPESVRDALDALRPDRIDHGIAAASDPDLLSRLAAEGTPLCVAPVGNVVTGAVPSLSAHPLPRLLEAGVAVTLSADDPLLFATTTGGEYEAAAAAFGLSSAVLRGMAGRAWLASFGLSDAEKTVGVEALELLGWPAQPAGSTS